MRLRILVSHGDYELLNLGDVAMLQSCVLRLSQQWPDAEIMVIAQSATDLAAYCPEVILVRRTSGQQFTGILPPRYRPVWQSIVPYLSGRIRSGHALYSRPRTALQAVRAADVVVAAGGGYVTDVWRWHATGVFSVLSLAQRLGKPTAMFGQGVGPIRQRMLELQARAVLPKLTVLSLREDGRGRELALSLGARPHTVAVTGDDALELVENGIIPNGHALGINVRVSGYAGVDPASAVVIGDIVVQAAAALNVPLVALPVSRHETDADLGAIRDMLIPRNLHAVLEDLKTPRDLISSAGSCRAIVTGSYHAAVFGLAQGVPAICITRSSYYDGKFAGLNALFPEACFVVSLGAPDFAARLRTAIHQAWNLPEPLRAAARTAATDQRDAGRAAYGQFRIAVEKTIQLSQVPVGT